MGDDTVWGRVAIAQYRDRMALVEMNSSKEFAESWVTTGRSPKRAMT